jgi:LacI family transcriptional regulator
MASMRRSDQAAFVGNLALVYVSNPRRPRMLPFQRDIINGAALRARQLGFSLMVTDIKQENISMPTLTRMLHARGALGVIIVHTQLEHELDGFPWNEFSMVEVDHSHAEVTLNAVCIEHYITLITALRHLRLHGYRRPGLFISEHRDQRLDYVWSAAFRSYQETHAAVEPVPVFRNQFIEKKSFLEWFGKYSPDVLIGQRDEAIDWLAERGLRAPDDFGFFNLNWNERNHPCAGLNLCPEQQGHAAVEVVVAQIHRQEKGPPVNPQTTMITGRWVDGPTLRPLARREKR